MLSKIKFYVLGLMSGVMLTGGIISYADEIGVASNTGLLQCSKMICSIWADGKEIDMDLPILNYEGRSYLPVRKLAEVTGANVTWDGDNRVINVKSDIKDLQKIKDMHSIMDMYKNVKECSDSVTRSNSDYSKLIDYKKLDTNNNSNYYSQAVNMYNGGLNESKNSIDILRKYIERIKPISIKYNLDLTIAEKSINLTNDIYLAQNSSFDNMKKYIETNVVNYWQESINDNEKINSFLMERNSQIIPLSNKYYEFMKIAEE